MLIVTSIFSDNIDDSDYEDPGFEDDEFSGPVSS